jgi:hypothetical protein
MKMDAAYASETWQRNPDPHGAKTKEIINKTELILVSFMQHPSE